jgi:rfaE bifunctional protein nucleotidyltransferase chain/domain
MTENKILDITVLKRKIAAERVKGRKIVFTNGCFDILHPGHVAYLEEAYQLGDFLVVGLNSDNSVKTLNKGKNRPIQNQVARGLVLAGLACVNAVIVFDEETPAQLIAEVNPDILVKGGDYKIEEVVGADFVISKGGKVEILKFVEGYSTSAIEKKILSS